ncbi:MAG: hypothetical protein A3E78_12665 [Alphaproteobacteria bacterium RIFCSPHIGHO2_12_FULL_63_12]|nr:MAG: hypothetical protein A3E78_12665 [Alphaproteobacteria bacterium RIFCSPHIGHO2_12_FULL_63_12]
MSETRKYNGPKIEGGIDAVVLGATPEGLAAAALLARAGFHVVLIETPASRPRERREFAPGYFAEDGDPLAATLDHIVVEALDLYRHGLAFSARRLETLVRFGDRAALAMPGDPALAGETVAAFSEIDAGAFTAFLDAERKTARLLADWFAGGERPEILDGAAAEAGTSSVDGAIVGRFVDRRLEDYLRAEAAFGIGARPAEPFTYLSFIRSLAGETAGLQGGVAAIEGGGRGLNNALRRACQAAGVTIRQTDRVRNVIVEWDRVAGVSFDDGAQIRAPIIVSSLPARETFLDFVGRARLDIEFTRTLDIAAPSLATVRFNLAINGALEDQRVGARLDRRFLFAPGPLEIECAFRAASNGVAPETAIGELVFPSAFDRTLAPQGCSTAALSLHPLAARPLDDVHWCEAISKTAKSVFTRLVGGAEIAAIEAEESAAAAPPLPAAMERRTRLAGASGLEGYFFCGPETLIGGGVSLSAGRRAADRARDYFRKGGFS